MKTHKDLIIAQLQFIEKRDMFMKINASFFLNLINQLHLIGEIPAGSLIKFRVGTDDNINIVEECLNLEDNGSCTMRISILTNGISQFVYFQTTKDEDLLNLEIQINNSSETFKYDISSEVLIEIIDFSDAINYIFEALEKSYTCWRF